MVTIRLARKGRIHAPFYHVVVTDKRSGRDGRFIEKVGYYDPALAQSTIVLKADRIQHWFSKGAQLSETVEKLAKIQKISLSREITK
ncbi:MAG: 30S ribosomal protein S16 [Pseudomonadota bacterium]|jgi:small subunit ribosomal protein S16